MLHPDGCQDYFWNIESGRVKATPVSDGRTIKGYADLVADNGDWQLRQYEREREREKKRPGMYVQRSRLARWFRKR